MTKDKDNELNVVKGEFKARTWNTAPRMPKWFTPEMRLQWKRVMEVI